jgi:alpha-1,2-mannosyltransferase
LRKLCLRSLAVVGLLAFLGYVSMRGGSKGNDFKYPYNAARKVWKTGELSVETQPRYPITFHVLLAPLASRSLGTAAAVWAILSVGAVAALPFVIGRLSGIRPRLQVLALAAVAPFFVDAIVLGQGDPINILLVAWGLLAVKEGRGFRGAGLIGLAGMIKILPLIHWGTALAQSRSPRVLLGIAATMLAGFELVALAVGTSQAISGFREQAEWVQSNEKPWHLVARGGDIRPNNESLPIVLARTFGDMPQEHRPRNVLVLARLPLNAIWAAWGIVLAAMAVTWAACVRPAGRLEPKRGLLGMFALTSIVMLAATPICWHHYFLWTLPAVLFLATRPALVVSYAVVSLVGSAVPQARGLGIHMALALVLFVLVAREILRSPGLPEADPSPGQA